MTDKADKPTKAAKTVSFETLAAQVVGVNNTVFKEAVAKFEADNPAIRTDIAWNSYLTRECSLRGLNG